MTELPAWLIVVLVVLPVLAGLEGLSSKTGLPGVENERVGTPSWLGVPIRFPL